MRRNGSYSTPDPGGRSVLIVGGLNSYDDMLDFNFGRRSLTEIRRDIVQIESDRLSYRVSRMQSGTLFTVNARPRSGMLAWSGELEHPKIPRTGPN